MISRESILCNTDFATSSFLSTLLGTLIKSGNRINKMNRCNNDIFSSSQNCFVCFIKYSLFLEHHCYKYSGMRHGTKAACTVHTATMNAPYQHPFICILNKIYYHLRTNRLSNLKLEIRKCFTLLRGIYLQKERSWNKSAGK